MGDNPDMLSQLLAILSSLASVLGDLVLWVGRFLMANLLLIVWIAWWLWGVNWSKTWRALAGGGWAPLVLLMIVVALAWSQVAPGSCQCLGFMTVPNFWWQLGDVAMLIAIAFFCGWLQGLLGWRPTEIDLEPPAGAAHDHAPH